MPVVPVAASQAINTSVREWWFFASSIFAVMFVLFAVGIWTAWSWGHLRPKPEEKPQGLPRGVEIGGLRFIAEANGVGADELGFRVVADGSATLRSVVAAFTDAHLLPKLPGGTRTWLLLIEERLVAVATQTWEHPRWWPPIEWSANPDEPFPVDGILRLRAES